MVVGGGSGIGREVALLLARKGAHLVVADADAESAATIATDAGKAVISPDAAAMCRSTSASADSLANAATFATLLFGGLDAIVNTAAIYPVAGADGRLTDAQWAKTFLGQCHGQLPARAGNRTGSSAISNCRRPWS